MSESINDSIQGLDDETRKMVCDTVRGLKTRILTSDRIHQWDHQDEFPEKIIRELMGPEIGLQLVFIPENYGGMGGGARDVCLLTKEMAQICLGVSTAFFAIQLGLEPILVGGTESQKQKWISRIAEGNSIVAYAATEPEAGSNLAALTTRAEPQYDDSGKIISYKLNGSKQFISNGGYADFICVLANTPEGPSFFIVEKGSPGLFQGKGEKKHGIRASNTSPLSFSDLIVPADQLIGDSPGNGMKQANQVFGYTRLMVGSMAVGASCSALSRVIEYAKERIQFGSPLFQKQGYTHKLIVPHVVRLKAALTYIDAMAMRWDSGDQDIQTESAIAKYFASESANHAADDAIQALGGYGYIAEYGVEKIKRDVKITCIYEGTSEILQNLISIFRWKKTRKTKGDFYRAIANKMTDIHNANNELGAIHYHHNANLLNTVIDWVHTHRLSKQQFVLFTLADMVTWLEVGNCLTQKIFESQAIITHMKAISRLFAQQVSQTIFNGALTILQGSKNCDGFDDCMNQMNWHHVMNTYDTLLSDMDCVVTYLDNYPGSKGLEGLMNG